MYDSSSVIGRSQCPKCLDSGRNNLVHYADGHSHCYSCSSTWNPTKGKTNAQQLTEEGLELMPEHTTAAILAKRGISESVIKQYDVKSVTNDIATYIRFDLVNQSRQPYTYRLRAVDLNLGELTRAIRGEKGKRIEQPLFGWQLVKKQSTIVICEGETDTLILASRLHGRTDVVVLGLVGSTLAERAAAFLCTSSTASLVLAFDNDDAGNEATQTFASYMERHDKERVVKQLHIPQEYKDVGDWLAANSEVDAYQAIQDAQPANMGGLLNSDQMAARFLAYVNKLSDSALVDLKFSSTLSKATRLMPGKLVGVIGDAGQGKSTFAEHLMMEAMQQNFNVLALSQEMLPEEVAVKLARMIKNQPLDSPAFLRTLSLEDKQEIGRLIAHMCQRLNVSDSFGQLSLDTVDEYLHKLTSVGKKPELVIVDHLLALAESLDRDMIIKTCEGLKGLARNHGCCVVVLSHVRKAPSGQGKRTVYRPTLSDAYGSNGLQMWADVILAVASDKQKQQTFVETVKVERMGGYYADVTLGYTDYCLHEIEDSGLTDYAEQEEYDDDSI